MPADEEQEEIQAEPMPPRRAATIEADDTRAAVAVSLLSSFDFRREGVVTQADWQRGTKLLQIADDDDSLWSRMERDYTSPEAWPREVGIDLVANKMAPWGWALLVLAMLLYRYCIGLWPHSGENDPPMFGDYEAQRHWMEVTTALPLGDWYRQTTQNDLMYWGLDYPPLTAFVSVN